jgi:hypothetical protein
MPCCTTNVEIAMANPEETTRPDGAPDGRAQRQPPTIEMKAVEVSPAGGAVGSGWPLRLAIVGVIGIVVALVSGALWFYPPERIESGQGDALAGEAAERENKLESRLADAQARLAKLESAPATAVQAAPDPTLANRIAALETAVAPLAEHMAALDHRLAEGAATARSAGERADAVAGLVEELKRTGADRGELAQGERSALEGLTDRVKALEALQAALKSREEEFESAITAAPAAMPDKVVREAVIAASLRTAVERDYPFTAELAAARTLGVDEKALAALEPFAKTGVPSQNELFRDLSALVPELLRVSAPAGHEGGYFDRLQASAAKMINIHPVGDVPGDDPPTVIGRIELKMVRQDVTGVMAELDKLPAPAKELAQPWRHKAVARQAAVDSARHLAAASFAKLGDASEPSPR